MMNNVSPWMTTHHLPAASYGPAYDNGDYAPPEFAYTTPVPAFDYGLPPSYGFAPPPPRGGWGYGPVGGYPPPGAPPRYQPGARFQNLTANSHNRLQQINIFVNYVKDNIINAPLPKAEDPPKVTPTKKPAPKKPTSRPSAKSTTMKK